MTKILKKTLINLKNEKILIIYEHHTYYDLRNHIIHFL